MNTHEKAKRAEKYLTWFSQSPHEGRIIPEDISFTSAKSAVERLKKSRTVTNIIVTQRNNRNFVVKRGRF